MLILFVFLTGLVATAKPESLASQPNAATNPESGRDDGSFSKIKMELMEFLKQLHDNSTDDLEARIAILENDVDHLEANFEILQDEMIEVQTELGDVEDQMNDVILQLDEQAERLTILEEHVNALWIACESSPCSNGATCVDINVDTFMCLCRDGYFGLTCSESYADTTFLATIVDDIISPVPNPITFNKTRINPGGHYDNTTGIYTVPIDGTYEFYIQTYSYPDTEYYILLIVDGFDLTLTRGSDYGSEPGYTAAVSQVLTHLNAGQEVWVQHIDLETMYGTQPDGTMDSWFSGQLISAD